MARSRSSFAKVRYDPRDATKTRKPTNSTLCPVRVLRPKRFACTMNRSQTRKPAIKMRISRLKRSEEHTSELQSHHDLVCRLLLEKKKKKKKKENTVIHEKNRK